MSRTFLNGIQIPKSAVAGAALRSDASGNADWQAVGRQANATPRLLSSAATATNADAAGGLPIPAAVRPGLGVRITSFVTNTAVTQKLTIACKFGTGNTSADGNLINLSAGSGSAVAGSGRIVLEIYFLTSTTAACTGFLYNYNGSSGITGLTNAFQTILGPITPGAITISTASNSFLGLYLSSSVANVVTIRNISYELISS